MEDIKKELKFIHITKNAGTFIEKLGKKYGLKWGKFHKEKGELWRHGTKEYGFYHHSPKEECKNKYDWFMIVRNPYSRILSEYYCTWGGTNNKVEHNKKQFNEFLKSKIMNRDRGKHAGHYREQYRYLDDSAKQYVIKYENMYEELPKLFSLYGLNINMKSIGPCNKKKKRLSYFTIDDMSEDLIELINKIYSKDFELFGYEKR